MNLTVVLPFFNEEALLPSLPGVVQRIHEALHGHEVRLLAVDDGSTDGTRAGLAAFEVIAHETNRGVGAAIATGITEATGDAVLIYDPDYNTDGFGDRTGLGVSGANDVNAWYDGAAPPGISYFGGLYLANVVSDPLYTQNALNFRGVDGLLVYDDAAFAEQPDDDARRQYLLDHSQPLYVSPLSGQVLRGPRGENE